MLTAAPRCERSQRNASEERRLLPLHTGSLFQHEDGLPFSCRVEKKQQKSSQVTVRMFPWMELVIYYSVLQVLDEADARFCQCFFFFHVEFVKEWAAKATFSFLSVGLFSWQFQGVGATNTFLPIATTRVFQSQIHTCVSFYHLLWYYYISDPVQQP